MGKLDINNQPERFSMIERAMHLNNMVADELGFSEWKIELPAKRHQLFLGLDSDYAGIQQSAFLEGFFCALAFCSESISAGKARDVCGKSGTVKMDALHQALNTAAAAMDKFSSKDK